ARDLALERVELRLQELAVGARERAVRGLHGQLAHAAEHVVDLAQRAFRRLRHRNTVRGVALGDGERADLRLEALADGEARRVVRRLVDTQTAGEAVEALLERVLTVVYVLLGF